MLKSLEFEMITVELMNHVVQAKINKIIIDYVFDLPG